MNYLTDVKEDALYWQLQQEQVPFNKWHSWLENHLNRQVLRQLFDRQAIRKSMMVQA